MDFFQSFVLLFSTIINLFLRLPSLLQFLFSPFLNPIK